MMACVERMMYSTNQLQAQAEPSRPRVKLYTRVRPASSACCSPSSLDLSRAHALAPRPDSSACCPPRSLRVMPRLKLDLVLWKDAAVWMERRRKVYRMRICCIAYRTLNYCCIAHPPLNYCIAYRVLNAQPLLHCVSNAQPLQCNAQVLPGLLPFPLHGPAAEPYAHVPDGGDAIVPARPTPLHHLHPSPQWPAWPLLSHQGRAGQPGRHSMASLGWLRMQRPAWPLLKSQSGDICAVPTIY